MKTIEEAAKESSKNSRLPLTQQGRYIYEDGFIDGFKLAQRWRPVEEELPNECTFVLTKYKNTYAVSWFQDGEFATPYNPTHWRPIELK